MRIVSLPAHISRTKRRVTLRGIKTSTVASGVTLGASYEEAGDPERD